MNKRTRYKSSILKEMYFNHHCSCVELTEKMGKSFPFVQKLVNELVDEGLIEGCGYAPSTGGRRAVTYSIKPDTIYIISVAMDQIVSRISVIDICSNRQLCTDEFELKIRENANWTFVLCHRIEALIQRSSIHTRKIIGVGIGMPGFIDYIKGENYSFATGRDKSITNFLSERLGMKVHIDNDSSLIALAEFRFGAAKNLRNIMVINLGWGVGLGMIINGELFRGNNGFAGEFSHIPLFDNNKLCQCGKMGCLETESSLLVLIEKARKAMTSGRNSALKKNFTGNLDEDWKTILAAAVNGDQMVIEILSQIGYNIGKGIVILIHLFNCEAVIISGRGAMAGKLWLAPIQQAVNEHCIPRLSVNTTIGLSSLDHHALPIGCAALVIDHFDADSSAYLRISNSRKYQKTN